MIRLLKLPIPVQRRVAAGVLSNGSPFGFMLGRLLSERLDGRGAPFRTQRVPPPQYVAQGNW